MRHLQPIAAQSYQVRRDQEADDLPDDSLVSLGTGSAAPFGNPGAPDQSYEVETVCQFADASRRFQELFQGVPIACFCFNTEGRIIEWNRACARLFCLSPDHVLEKYAWDVVGRREDQEITKALVLSVVAGQTYDNYEWQDANNNGLVRYFLGNAYPLHNFSGEATGGICASIDISARKYAEQALQESEERWSLAVRGNNDGIWDWNVRTGHTYFSARCASILGYDEDVEIARCRQDWINYIHPDDREQVVSALKLHTDRTTKYYYAEYRARARDGTYRWVLDRGQALWNRNGDVLRVAGSFTDITDRKRYEQQLQEAKGKLEELAMRDGLTGLKNRRAFQERFEMEYERASRYGIPLSVVLLDVDNFKLYNDAFGHPAGDTVLRIVAEILSNVIRDTDFVARYGGEEFILLLPHTSMEAALQVAERCRLDIAHYHWPKRSVTASLGVSTLYAGINISSEELVKAADDALYASKSAGRNLVIHAATMK